MEWDIHIIEELNNPHDYHLRSDLSDQCKESISRYEDNSSDINGYLRNGESAILQRDVVEIKTDISHIDSAHASLLSSLMDDFLLFRGISSDFGRYLLNLERFHENAYLSTSYSLYDAVQYAIEAEQVNPEKDGGIYLVVIEKKQGEKGIVLIRDHEILLPRNTEWIIAEAKVIESLTLNERSHDGVSTLFIPMATILYLQSI
ncbi:ADP-ribosyltransferase [Methanospirillum sp.]|uniref:ADP-ribosyltransferase n=1 Tax=Methanospirillum sp. TaxID=45200 RepID=UPI0035A0280A